MEPATLVPVLTGLAGVAVGGVIAEAREWLKLSRDRRRALNRVLYAQLDVWHLVLRADPDAAMAIIPRALAKLFGVPASDLAVLLRTEAPFQALLVQMMNEAIPEDIESRYQKAVNELADVDPVLSYRLSGRPQLRTVARTWRTHIETTFANAGASDEERTTFATLSPAVERETRRQLLESLESDIENVCAKLGMFQWRAVRNLLKREKTRLAMRNEAEFDALIRRIFDESGALPHTVQHASSPESAERDDAPAPIC